MSYKPFVGSFLLLSKTPSWYDSHLFNVSVVIHGFVCLGIPWFLGIRGAYVASTSLCTVVWSQPYQRSSAFVIVSAGSHSCGRSHFSFQNQNWWVVSIRNRAFCLSYLTTELLSPSTKFNPLLLQYVSILIERSRFMPIFLKFTSGSHTFQIGGATLRDS